LTDADIVKAEGLLRSFQQKFENVFGSQYVTPNIHLQSHIGDTLRRFGTAYASWTFPYERQIGTMEKTNLSSAGYELSFARAVSEYDTVINSELLRKYKMSDEMHSIFKSVVSLRQTQDMSVSFGGLSGEEIVQFCAWQADPLHTWTGVEKFPGILLVSVFC
jgi:hypothetical protein